MHFVVLPATNVLVALRVRVGPLALAHSIVPVSAVLAAVRPLANAVPLSNPVAHPLRMLVVNRD